jgi:hypothetical protein
VLLIKIVRGVLAGVTEFAKVETGVCKTKASLFLTLKKSPLLTAQEFIGAAGSKLKVSNLIFPSSQLLKSKTQNNNPRNRFIFSIFKNKSRIFNLFQKQ